MKPTTFKQFAALFPCIAHLLNEIALDNGCPDGSAMFDGEVDLLDLATTPAYQRAEKAAAWLMHDARDDDSELLEMLCGDRDEGAKLVAQYSKRYPLVKGLFVIIDAACEPIF